MGDRLEEVEGEAGAREAGVPPSRMKMALLIIAVFAVGVYVGWWWHSQVAIDKCLDLGGRWHSYGICDNVQKAPFD
jgi:hypothetical protein